MGGVGSQYAGSKPAGSIWPASAPFLPGLEDLEQAEPQLCSLWGLMFFIFFPFLFSFLFFIFNFNFSPPGEGVIFSDITAPLAESL